MGTIERLPPRPRRERLIILLACALAVAVVAGIVTALILRSEVAPGDTQTTPASDNAVQDGEGDPVAETTFDQKKLGTEDSDVTYCTIDGVDLQMDIHWPESGEAPFPAAVYIHGGGWNKGDKTENINQYLEELLPRGIVVFAINYRLAQEYQFPAMIEDAKCAVRHIRANASLYSIDPERIAGFGGSAGGHIVSLLGVAGPEAGWDDVGQYQGISSHVVAVVNMYGPTDLRRPEEGTTARAIQNIFGTEDYEDMGFASPITYITPDDPPFLLMHGQEDPVVPIIQSELFYEALQEAGIEVEFIRVANSRHSFAPAEKGVAIDPSMSELAVIMAEWLAEHLK